MKIKFLKYFVIINLLLLNTCIACIQNNNDDKEIMQMLKTFYIAHNSLWINTKDNFVLKKKSDSLNQKYCSLKLINKLKKEFKEGGLDIDLLTNDEGADENSLKTLIVKKIMTKANSFIITYDYSTMSPAYKPITKNVIIHVTVVMEKGSYKIDNVW